MSEYEWRPGSQTTADGKQQLWQLRKCDLTFARKDDAEQTHNKVATAPRGMRDVPGSAGSGNDSLCTTSPDQPTCNAANPIPIATPWFVAAGFLVVLVGLTAPLVKLLNDLP